MLYYTILYHLINFYLVKKGEIENVRSYAVVAAAAAAPAAFSMHSLS